MKLIPIILVFIGSSVFASTPGYKLKMDLSLNGKQISSTQLIVESGKAATVTQKTETEESFIEVVAMEGAIGKHQGILMKFVIGVIDQNGQRRILAQPQVLAKENEPAEITSEHKGDSVSLAVVVDRKSL